MRLLALLPLVALGAFAQTPDPRPAWTYDPVAVGNVRSYAQGVTTESTTYARTDSPTAVTRDGQRWVVRRTQRFARLDGGGWTRTETRTLVRFDTTAAAVLTRAEDGTVAPLYPCRLDVPLAPAGATCGDGQPYTKTEDGRLVFEDRGDGFSTVLQAGTGDLGGARDRQPPVELVQAVVGGETTGALPDGFPDSRLDPTPASRYAPMSVGDEWQYERSEGAAGPGRPRYRLIQVGETREIEGRVYVGIGYGSFEQGQEGWIAPAETIYVRFDTLTARVLGPDGRPPFGPIRTGTCSFDEPVSAPGADGVYCETFDGVGQEIARQRTGTLRVGADAIDGSARDYLYTGRADYPCGPGAFAAGIGYLGYECDSSAPGAYERLIYARVRQPDGSILELGQPYAVADEAAPEPGALVLSVGPNPTAGPVTLRLALPVGGAVRWELVDALGRMVWQRDDTHAPGPAAQAADLSGLPAGLYVARATTARGVATATVVRR